MPNTTLPDGFGQWSVRDQDLYRMRSEWLEQARPNQIPPLGAWRVWLLLAGRGFGKTRTAAEDIAYYALLHDGCRVEVVAPTFADIRDVCFEGQSGILKWLPERWVEKWNRSVGELWMKNGSLVCGFAGDEPDRLRGPEFHRAWVDELAAMQYADEAWMNIEMNCRLAGPKGESPQIIVTTTPRSVPIIRDLITRSRRRQAEKVDHHDFRKISEDRASAAALRSPLLDAACL
jgi:phage terminase large subunit-like protein